MSHGASGRAAVALGVWPALRLGVGRLMLGAGLVQAFARCPEGAGPLQAAVGELRKRAGSECVLSQEMAVLRAGRPGHMQSPGSLGWGQSSSVSGHLTWSPATQTWGTDRPKG